MKQPFFSAVVFLHENSLWQIEKRPGYSSLTKGKSHIRIRQRLVYPCTYVDSTNDGYILGYGSGNDLDDEYLHVRISNVSLQLFRDTRCTLPLFFAVYPDRIVLSNVFEYVVAHAPAGYLLQLNRRFIANDLLAPTDTSETQYEEVNILGERSLLTIRPEGCTIGLPESRPNAPIDPQAARQFKGVLEDTLDKIWQQIGANSDNSAFEISGGIDSATAPAYYAHINATNLQGYTMVFPGRFQHTQLQKVDKLVEKGIVSHRVTLRQTDYPLSNYFAQRIFAPYYTRHEIYSEHVQHMIDIMRKQQPAVSFVFTGIGGNELFEIDDEHLDDDIEARDITEHRQKTITYQLPPLMSYYQDYGSTHARPVLGRSTLAAFVSRNNLYIEQGIWPIAPFTIPSLVLYAKTITPKLRLSKLLLRAYHEAMGFPSEIYAPETNEHFGEYFESCARQNFAIQLERVLADSVLVEQRLVDPGIALELARSLSDQNSTIYFQLYMLINTALSLKQAKLAS